MLSRVTPVLITYNEAPNIARVLEKLRWASRIVVVDSGSTDSTLDLLKHFPSVEVFHRTFDDFATQWNFGINQAQSDWILSLDADYEISDALRDEIENIGDAETAAGFNARFVYRVYGRPLRGTLYTPRTVLFRRGFGRYINEGHTQRLAIAGTVKMLNNVIYHDDRKSLSRWFSSQQRYAGIEADYLLSTAPNLLSRSARIRRLGWPAPILVFVYVLFVKGCVFSGWAGWLYALQRLVAETMIALELIDRRLSRGLTGGAL